MLITKGRVFQGMGMSLMGPGCQLKLCGVSVSMIGAELSEAVGGIWPRCQGHSGPSRFLVCVG
jgi:hypothetical protein